MRIIRNVLYFLASLVSLFIIFLIYSTIDDYKPEPVEKVFFTDQGDILTDSTRITIFNWNIGYAGLDKSMDFFYDGGKQMRPAKEGVTNNLKGIMETLVPYKSFDFILLQEVDRGSKRSYHYNMQKLISEHFRDYQNFFAMNYEVRFVPIPVKEPMGKVESGLLTLSKYIPSTVDRYSFPGNYSWPMGIFMLDRCFMVNRYKVGGVSKQALGDGQKELVLINTHNSAYDDGSLRKKQMDFMKDILLSEYEKGNYVIVGGDWNQTPYGMKPELPNHVFDTVNLTFIDKDYPANDWTWAFDPMKPTNRRVAVPYDRETSLTTVIDCYLLSPNIKLEHIKTVDVGFAYSDHQPVELIVQLQ